MCRFIESLKVENMQLHLAGLHQERVERTAEHFGLTEIPRLQEIYDALEHREQGLFKLRITYGRSGLGETRLIPYFRTALPTFTLVEDASLDYRFKYENRTAFENLKSHHPGSEIIITQNGHLTDTTYANLIFKKGRKWYTPRTFLLNGVQRQHLLKTKKITEADITVESLAEYSHLQIINALNGFDETTAVPITQILNLTK